MNITNKREHCLGCHFSSRVFKRYTSIKPAVGGSYLHMTYKGLPGYKMPHPLPYIKAVYLYCRCVVCVTPIIPEKCLRKR